MKLIKLFFSITIFIWCVGFFYFLHTINNLSNDDRRPTESIIIWGDDTQNLYTGIQLLKLGYAPIVFITDNHNQEGAKSFIKTHHAVPEQFIFNKYSTPKKYDYATTVSTFVREHNLHSLRLVVSANQLPRAIRELGMILPSDIEIIPHPISPKEQDNYLVFKEYAKYTLVLITSFIGKENELDLPYS
jgi:hypothetical protein